MNNTLAVILGIYLGIGFVCSAVMVHENKNRPDSVLLTIGFFWVVMWPFGLLTVGLRMLFE